MSISFKCKKCGKGYKVGDDKAGKKIKCRQCAAPVQIPKADVDDFNEDWEEEAEYAPPTRRRAKSKHKKQGKKKSSSGSNQSLLIAGCIVGVLVLQRLNDWSFKPKRF